MAKTQDYTKVMNDMMGAFPMMDQKAMQDAWKTQAQMGEKMSKVVLEAAEKSTEISTKWSKDTLQSMGQISSVKDEPTEYTKAATDFASHSAETAAENMAAFAEIAKKVQMETVELMLSAGKDIQEDATAAVKKATNEAASAAKKASASAPAK